MRGYDRGYDYGLRGYRQTADARRQPVRTRFVGYGGDYGAGGGEHRPLMRGGAGYDREMRGGGYSGAGYSAGSYGDDYSRYRANPFPNRVTQAYNLEYVRPERADDYRVNYAPYGGDRAGRVGDMTEYRRPYLTEGGTRTMRGSWPMDWERSHGRYDWEFPNYRAGYGRWF